MKNFTIVLFVLCAYLVKSQPQITQGGTISLVSISPGIMCKCDTVKIGIDFKSAPSTAYVHSVAYFDLFLRYGDINTPQYVTIHSFKNAEFYSMQKAHGQFLYDTTYYYKYKIPCDFIQTYGISGSNQALADFVLDHFSSSTAKTTLVKNCVTGIEELSLNEQEAIYYDLRGAKIEKRYNELIIEQVGVNRRKIFIQK